MTQRDPYREELRAAVEAAEAAGREIMRLRQNGMRYGHKEDFELVSEADLHASDMLHEALMEGFPDTGWLGEEHADNAERLRKERVWIVDPIDGTREFLQGIPEFAVSIGLAVEGKPVLGVVHNPATGDTDAAVCVEVDERPLAPAPRPFDVLVSRNELRWRDIPPLPEGTRVAGLGSVAYRLALLSRGTGHAVITGYGRAEWDVAAGVALCRAVGLRVTDVLGGDLEFNQPEPYVKGILAGHGGVHDAIQDHFRRLGALPG
jgi:myo-inositol-1(or 4)-monophosphatase